MKPIVVFCIFFLVCCSLIGQTHEYNNDLDSLTKKSRQFYYKQQDSVYHYFQKIYSLSSENNSWNDSFYTLINWNRQSIYFYDLQQIKSNIRLLDSISLVHKKEIDTSSNRLMIQNSLLYDKAMYYYNINEYSTLRNALLKIIDSYNETQPETLTTGHAYLISSGYSLLAKAYSNEGKYDLAKQYYHQNIRFLQKHLPNNLLYLLNTYSLLGEVYEREGRYGLSSSYFQKSFSSHLKNNSNLNYVITDGCRLIQSKLALTQLDSANHYLNLLRGKIPEKHPFWHKYYEAEAGFYKSKREYQKSTEAYTNAISALKRKWKNQNHDEIALLYNQIGLMNIDFKKYDNALKNFQLGIEQLSVHNPNGTTLLKLLKNRAEALSRIGNESSYPQVITTVNQALIQLDTLKPTFKSQTDKLTLIEDVYPLIESGLNALYNLYTIKGEGNYIDQAFKYSEESKSAILLEALLNTKATRFGNIPPELLERESQLKSEIVHLEKKTNYVKEKTDTSEELLFDLKQEHRKLIADLEANYNDYFNLKYNTKTISLRGLQEELSEDEKLISYFYGNHDIYVVSVTKGEKQLGKIPITEELETRIKSAYKDLADPQSDIKELSNKTYQLYNRLLAPFITETDQELTLITDGLLNYIPFSALNTNNNDLTYLIEHSAIRYSNSATLLSELRNRPVNTPNVLAVAPSFDGTSQVNINRSALSPLPHNSLEAKRILSTFEGHSLLKNDASLENFKKEHKKYGILHLATHAIFNDSTPEYSYLAFSQNHNNNNEDLLFVADLYTLRTDADLITLSACETGIGELRRGEGFMGLSRGFFYGGASSIASTLWKVNDASSANLMGLFYTHLSKGESKDRAMQNAQITFLQNNSQNALAHPYYWSGYVLSGNSTPVLIKYHWGYWIIGAVILALLGFWAFTKKKRIS